MSVVQYFAFFWSTNRTPHKSNLKYAIKDCWHLSFVNALNPWPCLNDVNWDGKYVGEREVELRILKSMPNNVQLTPPYHSLALYYHYWSLFRTIIPTFLVTRFVPLSILPLSRLSTQWTLGSTYNLVHFLIKCPIPMCGTENQFTPDDKFDLHDSIEWPHGPQSAATSFYSLSSSSFPLPTQYETISLFPYYI